jgi:hypothetical protein
MIAPSVNKDSPGVMKRQLIPPSVMLPAIRR